MEVLRRKLVENKAAILADLDLNRELLSMLSRMEVLDITDCVKLQQIESVREKNILFVEMLQEKITEETYTGLIECLQKTKQEAVITHLMDVREEMMILSHIQTQLDDRLDEMTKYLSTEERRAGIYLTEAPVDDPSDIPSMTEEEVWKNVQTTMKKSNQQLNRCKAVIIKLHQDCATVAKQNTDIIEHTKECDAKIKSVLSYGRQSAKQNTVPKKTQDLFGNLMDDIEKLVKSRRNVIDKETEGKRHSTRIVRQCRDWIEGRSVVLTKLASTPGPGAYRSAEDGKPLVPFKRPAPKVANNGTISILDSLQLLEQELQDYIHKEILVTDKLELRLKHLQEKVHGFNVHGIGDVESALENIGKDPEHVEENLAIVRSCIKEINKEYSECCAFLKRVRPPEQGNTATQENASPSKKDPKLTARSWPSNFKRGHNSDGGRNKHIDNYSNPHVKSEPNQLLEQLKEFISKHEELKSEDQVVGNKYRAEMSKRKRDMEIAVQRKDDQIMRLQLENKEATAEKEKYRKLYNDTKIGVQRNFEAN
ncbi:uncharacterized protein LOC128239254 [Mya arenaria]|uniref:uncharacterized protein LOC128239254 n=1 Tax=Mya arenaria TaxID=6604 RepID=UPI0022E34BC8|nr:uncharacterized protein LOC128239254 [Mya arenaria]